MGRFPSSGAIALVAPVGLTGPAMTGTSSENCKFNCDRSSGHKGLSQPYAGPTTIGQSYGMGVAIGWEEKCCDDSTKLTNLR